MNSLPSIDVKRESRFVSWFWFLSIPAFYVIIATTTMLGVNSQIATIPYRLFLGLFGLWALIKIIKSPRKMSFTMIALMIFSVCFIIRLISDGYLGKLTEMGGPFAVLGGFVICALLPSFYGYYNPPLSQRPLNAIWNGLFVCTLFFIYLYHGQAFGDEGLRSYEAAVGDGNINAIKIGHVGALLVEVSLYRLLFCKGKTRWISLLGICGFYLIVISNSRSCYLAMGVILPLIVFSALFAKRISGIRKIILLIFGTIFCATLVVYVVNKGGYISSRFEGENMIDDYRMYLYEQCVTNALEHPVFGVSSVVLHPAGFYGGSESFLLDGLNATGLFMGSVWIGVVLLTIFKGVKLYLRYPETWFCIIFVHGVLFFATCGGLVNSIWGFISVVTMISIVDLKKQNNDKVALR